MFTNIEKKLKGIAIVNFVCGIFIAVACLIVMEEDGILIALIAFLISLISSWFIYAFAELLENTKRICHTMEIVFAGDISKNAEQRKQFEEAKKREDQEDQEKQAKAGYAPYWAKGPEDINSKKADQEKSVE